MRKRPHHITLLVLALVLGQWLGFAHGFKHSEGVVAEQGCELCLNAHGLDDLLPAAGAEPRAPWAARHETVPPVAAAACARRCSTDPPIRGPPLLA